MNLSFSLLFLFDFHMHFDVSLWRHKATQSTKEREIRKHSTRDRITVFPCSWKKSSRRELDLSEKECMNSEREGFDVIFILLCLSLDFFSRRSCCVSPTTVLSLQEWEKWEERQRSTKRIASISLAMQCTEFAEKTHKNIRPTLRDHRQSFSVSRYGSNMHACLSNLRVDFATKISTLTSMRPLESCFGNFYFGILFRVNLPLVL